VERPPGDQIDLLILHQALPSNFDKTLEAYRALETLLKDGKVRAIGVSNFMVEHLTKLLDQAEVAPAVNQIELHPYFQQPEVQAFNSRCDVHARLRRAARRPVRGAPCRMCGR
jgi:diketogulonate reductase-like aldo/keto reductase